MNDTPLNRLPARPRQSARAPEYARLMAVAALSLAGVACASTVLPAPAEEAGAPGATEAARSGGAGGTPAKGAGTGGTGSVPVEDLGIGGGGAPSPYTYEPSTGGVVGVGGFGDVGGVAGDVGYVESCAAAVPAPVREWSPIPELPAPPAASVLQATREAMVGDWWGIAAPPWVEPYPVALTFMADGHYSARCTSSTAACPCVAFYYGTDRDDPLKQWRITAADGVLVSGTIDVAFMNPPEPASLPAWQGLLQNLELDATLGRMRFDFWRDDGYGPIHYELEREPVEDEELAP